MTAPIRAFAGPPSATPTRLTALESHDWDVLLLPSSIEETTNVVTRWRDLSKWGRHFTPTGSPEIDTGGFDTGVLFDGVNDHMDGTLSMSDEYCTLFVLSRTVVDTPGDYAWVVDASDNGAIDRSISHYHAFGSVLARQSQNDSGNASLPDSSTTLVLHRIQFSPSGRVIFKNGNWFASSAVAASPARTITSIRLGSRRDGSKRWNGILYAIGLVRGQIDDRDIEKREAQFLALAGLDAPYRWPLTAATATADPRWVLPAVTPAIVGRPLVLFRDGVWYRDGTDIAQAATWTGGSFDTTPSDRWSMTPTTAGDTTLTITAGAHTASTTVRAVPMLASNATKRRFLCVGDSRTNRGGSGWIEVVGNDLGSLRVEMVGTKGPASGYTYKHEGIDSKTWTTFSSSGSPFWVGGGAEDIAAYIALLANPPDAIIWSLGQNDVTAVAEGALDATITTAFGLADARFAAFTAELPLVWHIIATNSPLAMDPALGSNTVEARLTARRKVHRYVERVIANYSDREDERIIVCNTFPATNTIAGYGDAIHENNFPGHQQIAKPYLATLVHAWPLLGT